MAQLFPSWDCGFSDLTFAQGSPRMTEEYTKAPCRPQVGPRGQNSVLGLSWEARPCSVSHLDKSKTVAVLSFFSPIGGLKLCFRVSRRTSGFSAGLAGGLFPPDLTALTCAFPGNWAWVGSCCVGDWSTPVPCSALPQPEDWTPSTASASASYCSAHSSGFSQRFHRVLIGMGNFIKFELMISF